MKFLFLQKNAFPLAGVMSISALIKQKGWEADIALTGEEDPLKKVREFRPDVIGFTVFTGEHHWALNLAKSLKRKFPKILIILGGPHPTYYPQIIFDSAIDAIVQGEGEGAVMDLLNNMESGKSLTKIENLWFKKGKRIFKNPIRPLISDLDKLPPPDREIYYRYKFLKEASVKQFLTGRGCPYNCSFCSNHLLRRMYQGKGQYLRRVSPKKMIEDIKNVQKLYGFKTLSFTDDVFISDLGWLKQFLPLYKKAIGAPFMCNVTANSLKPQSARLLAKGGCYGIAMGIESGKEETRFKVLNKFVTDEQIKNTARLAKKYGFLIKTYNILSLPGETLADALQTVKLNAAIKPDSAAASLLQPFPEYDIARYAIKKGFLPKNFGVEDVGESIYLDSPIQSPEWQEIENLQALFPFLVAHPQFISIAKPLLKIHNRRLFRLISRFTYGYYTSKVHKLSLLDKLRYLSHLDPLKA